MGSFHHKLEPLFHPLNDMAFLLLPFTMGTGVEPTFPRGAQGHDTHGEQTASYRMHFQLTHTSVSTVSKLWFYIYHGQHSSLSSPSSPPSVIFTSLLIICRSVSPFFFFHFQNQFCYKKNVIVVNILISLFSEIYMTLRFSDTAPHLFASIRHLNLCRISLSSDLLWLQHKERLFKCQLSFLPPIFSLLSSFYTHTPPIHSHILIPILSF